MFDFLKKLFGKNEKVEPRNQESLRKQPVVEPKPYEQEASPGVLMSTEEKADFANEDPDAELQEELKEEMKKEQKQEMKKEVKEQKQEVREEPKTDEPVYHIKPHSKGWQVILPDAQRATRVLDTQKEAIEYCKENNYSYTVHKK